MANKKRDLTGMRAGKLVAVAISKSDDYGRAVWLCNCDCGNTTERRSSILVDAIKHGKASHCGCSPVLKTHGLTKGNKNLYWVWAAMIQRCTNENSKDFKDYGAKGISICDDWRSDFASFHEWSMSNGYQQGLTIDRTNNEKGYNPENCAWVTIKKQMRNQRKTVMIEWGGEMKPLTELAEIAGISEKTMRGRVINLGWSIEKAMTTPAIKGTNQYSGGAK